MRRITVFVICLLLICSVTVTAAPAESPADTIYIPSEGNLPKQVTYHGDEKEPALESGRNGGQTVTLNGTDYLTVDIADLQAPFTLSAWVNWQGDTADQRIFSLVKQDSENYLSLSPFTDTAVVGKSAANGVTLLTSCFKDEQFIRENYYHPSAAGVTDALKRNLWYHIAFTVTETSVTVYIDGVNWQTVTLPFSYAELGADTLYIGSAADGNNGFTGQVQAFTLHGEVLDAATIARKAKNIPDSDTETTVNAGTYAAAILPAAESLQQEKTIVLTDDNTAGFSTATTAFFENPQIATGQTVSGTLTVQNRSGNPVSLQLYQIVLPAEDTAAYQYLSEIHVTIMQESTLLFDGPYTALDAGALGWYWQQLPNNRRCTYTIILSRPFSSVVPTEQISVNWVWETSLFPMTKNPLGGNRTAVWLLLLLAVSAVAAGFSAYWAIIRRPRRIFTVWDTAAKKVHSIFTKDTSRTDEYTE